MEKIQAANFGGNLTLGRTDTLAFIKQLYFSFLPPPPSLPSPHPLLLKNRGQLLNERICTSRGKLNPFWKAYVAQGRNRKSLKMFPL